MHRVVPATNATWQSHAITICRISLRHMPFNFLLGREHLGWILMSSIGASWYVGRMEHFLPTWLFLPNLPHEIGLFSSHNCATAKVVAPTQVRGATFALVRMCIYHNSATRPFPHGSGRVVPSLGTSRALDQGTWPGGAFQHVVFFLAVFM